MLKILQVRNKDKYSIIAYAFAISSSLLNFKNIITTGSAALYRLNSTLNIALLVVCIAIYFYAFYKVRVLRLNSGAILKLIIICLFWIGTWIFNPYLFNNSYVVESISDFLIYVLPAFILLPMIYDFKALLSYYYKLRHVYLFVTLVTVFLILQNGAVQGAGERYLSYSMSFGRALILPTILYFSIWFRERKWIDLLGALFFVAVIIFFGSRFPLICIGTFVIFNILRSAKKNPLQSTILSILIIGSVMILVFGGEFLQNIFDLIFLKFGIRSRGLEKLFAGDILSDSGRSIIHQELIAQVNKSPIIGYGAGGGNVALNNGLAHGLIYDIFGNLGYLFGVIFILLVCLKIIKLWNVSKNKYAFREFLVICLCMFAPISTIQMGLWTANYMWYLIIIPTINVLQLPKEE